MKRTLKDIARIVGGTVVGDANTPVEGVSPLESAKEGDLTFALESSSLKQADGSGASALVIPHGLKTKKPAVEVKNPRLALAKILVEFSASRKSHHGIHKSAVISKSSKVGKDAYIGAYVVIEDDAKVGKNTCIHPGAYIGSGAHIGDNCTIHSNASIYYDVKIGNNVIIHSGAAIGVDGFGFAQDNGKHVKIPQIGTVIIEDDVEVYANATIARATMGATIIGKGTKIDCSTHVAHNCNIGEDCALTALIGFAGGVTFGKKVYVGGMAGFQNKINIGDNTVVMAKAGVTKNIPANSVVSGFPAQDHKKELEELAAIRKLPALVKKIENFLKSK